ncbi:lysine-specific demethylase 2B-like isoform X4 [Dysidea avara]|uniref:lysine-specific demethylase 2B-like isoform X4 n=1 Tax=Dysidea avara TaxID=196820 RepID=UPI00332D3A69
MCPHMTLDNEIDMYINQDDYQLADQQDDAHNHDNSSTTMHSLTHIPRAPYQTAGSKLLCLQKQLRDELAKCTAAVFMINDIEVLEMLKEKVHGMHLELVSAASTSQTEVGLLAMKQLMKEEVLDSRKRSTKISRANRVTKKYSKMKRKTKGECPVLPKRSRPVQRDDPLQAAANASVGRPKGKKNFAATEMMDHGGISQSDKSQLTSTTSEQALLTHSQLMDDKFSHAKKGQKRQGCGQCEACTKADCGKCHYCLDKKKFGGKERLKQRCIHRKCI